MLFPAAIACLLSNLQVGSTFHLHLWKDSQLQKHLASTFLLFLFCACDTAIRPELYEVCIIVLSFKPQLPGAFSGGFFDFRCLSLVNHNTTVTPTASKHIMFPFISYRNHGEIILETVLLCNQWLKMSRDFLLADHALNS